MILQSEYEFGEEPPLKDLPSMIFESMQRYADRTFLIDAVTGREYSFGDCLQYCRKIAQALYYNLGVRKGDLILMLSKNSPEYVLFKYGAAAIGAVLSMINPLYTVEELGYFLNDSKPIMAFVSQEHAAKVQEAARVYHQIKDIIVLGEASGCVSYKTLLENEGTDVPRVTFDPKNDIFVMPYSSGTTGRPKGVMLSQWNFIFGNRQSTSPGIEVLSPKTREVVLIYTPLYHIFAIFWTLTSALAGHTAVIMPKYELRNFIDVTKRYKVTTLNIVPPTVVEITKNPSVRASDFDSVHTFIYGSAPLGMEVEREFSRKFCKQELRQVYGMTELTTFVLCTPKGIPFRPGSTGKIVPRAQMRFVDTETGKDVEENTNGEILVRGDQVIKGYFKNPSKTTETIDQDGFLHTGDVGYYDKDGFVYIVDRVKELIKYKATQVSPADIEGLILSHPAVADSAVVGVPDDTAGELPRAYMVLKPGHSVTEIDITEFVSKRVAPHKRLRGGVKFVGEIPKSPSGKILRKALSEEIGKELHLKAKL